MTHHTNPIIFHIKDVGWRVTYSEGEHSASTIVEYDEVYNRGAEPINEAIEFVKNVVRRGYNAVSTE